MLAEGKVIQGPSDVLQVSYGDDSGLWVEFYYRAVKNEKRSLEAGYAVFENKEYVKILAAGDKTKNWDRPVRKVRDGQAPSDLERFPRQWAAFQSQQTQNVDGLPLEEWPGLSPADVAMLKSVNIQTVEQLAAMGDHSLTFMGARGYRDKAKAYLEKAKDGAASLKWAKEKQEMQDQIDALKNQMQGFANAGILTPQKASASPEPKKRGPKPKVKDEQNIPPIDAASE